MVDKAISVTPIQCAAYGFRVFFMLSFGFLLLNVILFLFMGNTDTWDANKELKEKIKLLEYYKSLQDKKTNPPSNNMNSNSKNYPYKVRCKCPPGQPCKCLRTPNCRCRCCSD